MEKEEIKDILEKFSVPVDIQGHGICDIIDSSDFEKVAIDIAENLVNSPNLDNLLELAREEAKRKHGKGLVPLFEYENQSFFDGAKFIIDKLKELGNESK